MCAITTLVLNDCMGGKIGKTYVDDVSHYFNIVDDEIIDLTASQFNHPIDYSNYQLVQRKDILANVNTSKRYKTLKERLSVLDMKHEKSCGTIIIDRDKILLIGAKDDGGKMFWSFPKGHQENRETDIETALRETFEEVGLEIEIIDQKPIIVSHFIHSGTAVKDIYLFLAKPKSNTIKLQANEVELCRWINFNKVDNYLTGYYKEAWQEVINRKRNTYL